jgi:hypothetical protein
LIAAGVPTEDAHVVSPPMQRSHGRLSDDSRPSRDQDLHVAPENW